MKSNVIYILILLCLSIFLTGCANQTGEYDDFAKCLSEKNVKMYGAPWCSHCRSQKSLFGDSFQYVDYIDCDKNSEECSKAGIDGYPAWVISARKHFGEQSLERLASLSGCELK